MSTPANSETKLITLFGNVINEKIFKLSPHFHARRELQQTNILFLFEKNFKVLKESNKYTKKESLVNQNVCWKNGTVVFVLELKDLFLIFVVLSRFHNKY